MRLFGGGGRELEGAAEALGGGLVMLEAPVQFAFHRVEQMLAFKPVALRHGGEGVEPGLGAVQMGHGDGAVECDDGGGLQP